MALLSPGDTWAGTSLGPAACPACDRVFLVPEAGARCPHCAQALLESSGASLRAEAPEISIPSALGEERLRQVLEAFVKPVWFKPASLKASALAATARRAWVPLWLVDADVTGQWRGEVGYDYQVESARESFKGGQWVSQTLVETRIRWEHRLGTLSQHYDNVPAPALTEMSTLEQRLGGWALEQARPCEPALLDQALVRVPDLDPGAAWGQAQRGLELAAAVTCQDAARAQHMREFYLGAHYAALHWTWLLAPMWICSYVDHRGESHPVWVHGTTGKTWGPLVSSSKRGLVWAAAWAAVGLAIITLGALVALAGVVLLPLLPVGGVIALVGCVPVLVALWPALWPWLWNRRQRSVIEESRRPV